MAQRGLRRRLKKENENDMSVFSIAYNSEEGEIELLQGRHQDEETASTSDVYVITNSSVGENDGQEDDVTEILEHVCGRCERTYSSFNNFKNHIASCNRDKFINESYEELTLDQIKPLQKNAGKLAEKNICYCCEENLETAHTGHIRCQECPKSFKNAKSFQRHVSFLHSTITDFACTVCNAKCPTNVILDIHEMAHKLGKPFACQKCGKEFTRKYHLQRHQQHSNCDPNKVKPALKCNVCNKEFFRIDNLRSHLRNHIDTNAKTRDYQCPYCDKAFLSTTTMNIHVRTHTGEKPFICDLCERGFPSNGALRKHRRSHTGEKPFKCSVCDRAFSAKEVLNRHMKTHTGVRPHVCSTCGKSFIQATQLKTHLFNHTGKNGFPCTKCGIEFNRKMKLIEHIRDYHNSNENIFDCQVCDLTFDSKEDLYNHIKEDVHRTSQKCRCCKRRFLKMSKHLSCAGCQTCSDGETVAHTHIRHSNVGRSKKTSVSSILSVYSRHREATTSEESGCESTTTRKPRKLKILTSKLKKNIVKKESVEIIVNKIDETKEGDEDVDGFSIWKLEPDEECEQELELKIVNVESKFKSKEEVKPNIDTSDVIMNDEMLRESVGKLLNLLLDKDLLAGFGWPIASVEHVLSEVITQCGHEPANLENCYDYSTVIRENIKLLFTVVIDNASFKNLLNNHTIDEVIHQILQMTAPN